MRAVAPPARPLPGTLPVDERIRRQFNDVDATAPMFPGALRPLGSLRQTILAHAPPPRRSVTPPPGSHRKTCLGCYGTFYPKRAHAKTCSDRCRQILSRLVRDK